jgi:hypothetical protein
MLYRGTAGDGCRAFFKDSFRLQSQRNQEDFLRRNFLAVSGFAFRGALDGSEIQAGASLAGNDSWEASSTGSRLCETSSRSPASRSSDFGGKGSRFPAGLAIGIHFSAVGETEVIHRISVLAGWQQRTSSPW